MSPRSELAFIEEAWGTLRQSLPGGMSFDDWYGEHDMDISLLAPEGSSLRETVVWAVAYLQGVADGMNLTFGELIDEYKSATRTRKDWTP